MLKKKSIFGWCLRPLAGLLLWLASATALVFAWLSGNGFMLGRSSVQWYGDAMVLGVLAIGSKLGVIIKRGMKHECGSWHEQQGDSEIK